MKCKICGAESDQYPLCRACNAQKEKDKEKCGTENSIPTPCPTPNPTEGNEYLYNAKKALMTRIEQEFYEAIRLSVPDGYCVFPQINLASFIDRTDDMRFRNELFRNIDFLITDAEYAPQFVIEINDRTHLTNERKERDKKVQKICEEAGIPILKFWTVYGVNTDYIKERINATIEKLPVPRVHHFDRNAKKANGLRLPSKESEGCYVATCVYGSYDCPEVWVLRRYRDTVLAESGCGRAFVQIYYAVSPTLVKCFGRYGWFVTACKSILDKFVAKLKNGGLEDTPYTDKNRAEPSQTNISD